MGPVHNAHDLDQMFLNRWAHFCATVVCGTGRWIKVRKHAGSTAISIGDRAMKDHSSEIRLPLVEEQIAVGKRAVETGRVRVSTSMIEEAVTVHESLARESVEVTRVPVDREVTGVPTIREEGDVTIVPVLEERLVIEKRLFVVEEIHLRRNRVAEGVEIPATLKRTHVEVERRSPDQQEDQT